MKHETKICIGGTTGYHVWCCDPWVYAHPALKGTYDGARPQRPSDTVRRLFVITGLDAGFAFGDGPAPGAKVDPS